MQHATPGTLRVLIENERGLGPVFEIDRKRFADACERFPEVGGRVEATFSYDLDRFGEGASTADVIVGWNLPVRDLRSIAPRLRWLHLTGAGVNHLAPFDWVPPGVVITNNRGVHAPKTEEFAALAALMLANRIPLIATQQRDRRWDPVYSGSIARMTAGIVGVGNMGGAVAVGCKRLGMRVIGLRRGGAPHPSVDVMVPPGALDSLLSRADIVFVCTPLTPQTRHLIGAREIAAMKPGAGLVNLSRGGVVDAAAVEEALRRGHLSGALIDVFEPEPLPPDASLWACPNLLITPHCSSDDAVEYVPRTLDLIFDNLRRLMGGLELRCAVRPELGY